MQQYLTVQVHTLANLEIIRLLVNSIPTKSIA